MLFLGAIIVSSTDSHVKIITAMLESDLLNLKKVDFRKYHISRNRPIYRTCQSHSVALLC